MATSTELGAAGNSSQLAHGFILLSPIKALTPPEPIPDARGSLNGERFRELAEKHKPPTNWYEGNEEQLF